MKKWMVLSIALLTWMQCAWAASGEQKVRRLHLRKDDIALVKTAVGVATLVQVPDPPTSVVLGDTNAFKVEYLETAITIKPLSPSAKSNLYIYTEARRFNVSLVAVPQPQTDYIVYLEPESPNPDSARERWRPFRGEKTAGPIRLKIKRLGVTGEFILADFELKSDRPVQIAPEWFWITQRGKTVAIQSLNLSDVKITPNTAVQGLISMNRADVAPGKPILFEFRAPEPLTISLPEVSTWKTR